MRAWRTRVGAVLLATAVVPMSTAASGGLSQAPPPSPQAPAAAPQPPAAPSDLRDMWLVIYNVLPAKTADFEAVATAVQRAMRTSEIERRRRQAADMRVHRSAIPNPDGHIMYFVQIPTEASNDVDRTGLDVLIDAVLPAQATALKTQLQEALDPRNPSGNTLMIAVR